MSVEGLVSNESRYHCRCLFARAGRQVSRPVRSGPGSYFVVFFFFFFFFLRVIVDTSASLRLAGFCVPV